jgi:hypothetical protein
MVGTRKQSTRAYNRHVEKCRHPSLEGLDREHQHYLRGPYNGDHLQQVAKPARSRIVGPNLTRLPVKQREKQENAVAGYELTEPRII